MFDGSLVFTINFFSSSFQIMGLKKIGVGVGFGVGVDKKLPV